MPLLAAHVVLSSTVLAAPLSETSNKLKWKVHRTVGHRESATAGGRATMTANAAQQKRAWQAAANGESARRRPAPSRGPGTVIQASAQKSDPFQDPFEDGASDSGSNQTATQPTSQPTAPSDPFPTPDNPTLPPDIEQIPDDPQRTPFEDTMPENRPVVPDLPLPMDEDCGGYKGECRKAVEALRDRDITKIIFGIVIEGKGGKPPVEGVDYPCECLLGREVGTEQFAGRDWAPTTFTWKAAGTCFKPLYFQDVQLERYGHSWNPVVQPFMSAAHFFISVPLLPYKMGLRSPNECVYSLGYYRPGSCAPYMIEPIPLSLRAAAYEALGVTAFTFWFWPPPTGP